MKRYFDIGKVLKLEFERNMERKPTEGNSHLPIPKEFNVLLKAIEKFNKQKHHIKL